MIAAFPYSVAVAKFGSALLSGQILVVIPYVLSIALWNRHSRSVVTRNVVNGTPDIAEASG